MTGTPGNRLSRISSVFSVPWPSGRRLALAHPGHTAGITRTFPLGLRLGVVTSLIGGPFFLWLLRRPR